ncbi:MAG TPA: PilN domain-containing protein [Actinomycetota bacterium]|nr:PilN domain-containing protein [Actinomycetota bacterium]
MRINLLPPEYLERQRARRRTIAVVAVGLIVLLALGAFYLLQAMRLAELEEDIAAQEARNAQLSAQIAELQNVAQLQLEVEAARNLLASLLADRVRWSSILRDISLVIPGEAWLTGLSGTVDPDVGVAVAGDPATAAGGLIGQITFNGFAFEHRDVALWLSRLEDVRGFVNPWLSSSQKSTIAETEVVQFTNSVDLSERALATRREQP